MNKEKNEKLKEYLTAKIDKNIAIRNQNFEAAANARDVERDLSVHIYNKYINKGEYKKLDDMKYGKYIFFDNEMAHFFDKEYAIILSNLTPLSIKLLNRNKNLDDLGI